ncbi:MAG: hypothetical protein L0I24_14880, partial [Pseudonocardia sp.]|nr:hypothetical protein [Pseudonocardia sp.]
GRGKDGRRVSEIKDELGDMMNSKVAVFRDEEGLQEAFEVVQRLKEEAKSAYIDDQGTDLGAGGLVLVVGNRANGGIRSEFPGLASLDDDDNLKVSTEFRTVYASLLESWMGVEAARVLPGIDAARLPLIR